MFYSNNFKNLKEIQHCFFSRKNGNSKGIYESLNCGIGSKDDSKSVYKNLEIVAKNFKIKRRNLILMNQTHRNSLKIIEKEFLKDFIELKKVGQKKGEVQDLV